MNIRYSRPTCVVVAILLSSGCNEESSTSPGQNVTYPAKAVDAAPVTWGTQGGIAISGGYGSAVVVDPTDPSVFWIMTDRGPNTTTTVANRLLFPLPNFVPTIGKFRLVGDSLRRIGVVDLKNAAGVSISGRPNPAGQGATGESGIDAAGAPITPDPDGMDSEGLALVKDKEVQIVQTDTQRNLSMDHQLSH